jgi:hypothetical protein
VCTTIFLIMWTWAECRESAHCASPMVSGMALRASGSQRLTVVSCRVPHSGQRCSPLGLSNGRNAVGPHRMVVAAAARQAALPSGRQVDATVAEGDGKLVGQGAVCAGMGRDGQGAVHRLALGALHNMLPPVVLCSIFQTSLNLPLPWSNLLPWASAPPEFRPLYCWGVAEAVFWSLNFLAAHILKAFNDASRICLALGRWYRSAIV